MLLNRRGGNGGHDVPPAGVMTWDADNDAKGVDGNAQWAYSLGIKRLMT
jgi:hypothetical protein